MLNRLLSLFLKPNCPLCQRSAQEVFCDYCNQKLADCQLDFSQQQRSISSNFILLSWGKYDRELKRALALLKYKRQKAIGEILGIWLGQTWLDHGYDKKYPNLIITPIPCHSERLKTRGYNQADLIARGFAEVTGYSLKSHLLSRQKNTEAMFGLDINKRKKNIKQAFKLGADYRKLNKSRSILIIDDIYTTGTTVNEANRVLQQANLNTIGVATVCRVRV